MCLVFGALYILNCLMIRSSSYGILLLGRFLSGIATSILFSSFEAWMIKKHNLMGFSDEQLKKTFSLATRWNGFIAVSFSLLNVWIITIFQLSCVSRSYLASLPLLEFYIGMHSPPLIWLQFFFLSAPFLLPQPGMKIMVMQISPALIVEFCLL